MANIDIDGTLNYWTEGTSSGLIKAKLLKNIGIQVYWYNGSTEGYLAGSSITKPLVFSVLIGF